MSRTRKLDPIEIRVLGALLEKEQTTPDHYPLTTNAVIAACNQKSNRDPVMQLGETEIVEALDRLRQDVLVWRSEGARAERWEHRLDRRWNLDKASKAILTLLLLRGPQTPGELRTRSERMHAFGSVDEVDASLRALSEGFDAMVCELPRRPGQREARWMHLEGVEGDPRELAEEESVAEVVASIPAEMLEAQRAAARRDTYDERLVKLEETVAALSAQMRELRVELGLDEGE